MDFYNYFQVHADYFWNWEENTEVISITHGPTIAYKAYVFEALSQIHEQGLPPFGSFLLAIIATNKNGETTLDKHIKKRCNIFFHHPQQQQNLGEVFDFLYNLSQLPEEYKSGYKRIQVFQSIFDNCHNLTGIKKAKQIIEIIQEQKYNIGKLVQKRDFSNQTFHNDFKCIRLLNKKFPTTDSIIEAIADLPPIIEATPLDLLEETGHSTASPDFIEELTEHPKTFHVGSLIKHIWSGLTIPMHSTLPSNQKLGGVADISNKGTFDQLLISEFAHDDLTFLSRLANQEALYLNREQPPAPDVLARHILIDGSIKTWGTPRTIAFACMLAIANHPKTNIDYKAFWIGNVYQAIEFENIHKIIKSLQFLDAQLSPSNGINAFFENFKQSSTKEAILITSVDALRGTAMQKILQKHQDKIRYVIATDEQGKIVLYRYQNRSRKQIQSIQLPLNQLWDKKRKRVAYKDRQQDLELAHTNYPLLFPPQRFNHILLDEDYNCFALTKDKKLFVLLENSMSYKKGWHLIHSFVPKSATIFEIGQVKDGPTLLFTFSPKNKEVIIFNLSDGTQKKAFLDQWHIHDYNQRILFKNDKFIYQNTKGQWEFNYKHQPILSESLVIEKHLYRWWLDKKADIRTYEEKLKFPINVLKNVRQVYINYRQNLMFNNHELVINHQKQFRLKNNKVVSKSRKVHAKQSTDYPNIFEFPDGSNVSIHRSGMFILQSSRKELPTIFVPSMLDTPLGVATEKEFAGNQFFFNPFYKGSSEEINPEEFYFSKIRAFINEIWNARF